MSQNSTEKPGQSWTEKMAAQEPAARELWPAGATFDPHNGVDSDANLHYADLLAEPDVSHDPMAGWTPPATEDAAAGTTDGQDA